MGLGGLLPGSDGGQSAPGEAPQANSSDQKTKPDSASAEMLSAVTKLAPLLSAPKDDDTTRLLSALRPFLSQSRAKRLDEAERLLSVSRVLSIMKESKLM